MFFKFLSNVVALSILPYRNAHELWTKLQDKYGVSIAIEDDCSPSTSGRDEFSSSSTSPTCGKPQNNVMVSRDKFCNFDSELIVDDILSLSCCNDSSLDLNTYSTINVLHACVDSPCISSKSSSSDDNNNNNDDEEDDVYFNNKGLMILNALSKNKNACDNLFEIMSTLVERGITIEALEASEEKGKMRKR